MTCREKVALAKAVSQANLHRQSMVRIRRKDAMADHSEGDANHEGHRDPYSNNVCVVSGRSADPVAVNGRFTIESSKE